MPWQGLGSLRFGMTPVEVAEHDATYGAPEVSRELTAAEEEKVIEETFALMGDSIPPNERGQLAELMRQQFAVARERRTEVRHAAGLVLDYVENALDMIVIAPKAPRAHLDGLHPLVADPLVVVEALGLRNGGDVLAIKSSLYFDRLGIHLTAFVRYGARGFVALDEPEARAVSLNARTAEIDTTGMTRIATG